MLDAASLSADYLDRVNVVELGDKGMGGLRFIHRDTPHDTQRCRDVARMRFDDVDGVEVQLVLDVDRDGMLYELDIWKVDNSPVIEWPEVEAIAADCLGNLSEH